MTKKRVISGLPGVVESVHDGDTFRALLDLGFNVRLSTLIRIEGINAPELAEAAGLLSRDFVKGVLPPGCKVRVTSRRLDKYGRCQGVVYLADGSDLGSMILKAGHARPLDGYSPALLAG